MMSGSSDGRLLVGRYQLEVLLGRGGFGQVWRARDLALSRPVAVKLVELTDITDPAQLAETIVRFRREATTIAALRHRNIVTAYDAGRVGSELFLVMELAEGASLADLMERRAAGGIGRFPVASVLDIAEQACAGLGAAHAVGVVHRDIKPGNLTVDTRLRVKIIDFGIVRLLEDNSPRLTQQSIALGTPEYMSPEQAQSADLDGRADLYSLGCVMYELLAGVPPFTAADPAEVLMMQLIAQAVPLDARRAGLPAGLSELVAELMAKDRAERPLDAQQVIARIGVIRAALRASGADRAEPTHEADRSTVLTPNLLVGLAGDAASADGRNDASADGGNGDVYRDDPAAYGAAVTRLPPEAGAAGLPGPVGPADAAGVPVTTGAVPSWPQPPKRRPVRRRLRTAVSTLITVVIVGAAGAYAWARTHRPPLKVIGVTVAARPGTPCGGTVDVYGTIFTNGNGGQVGFQWVRNGVQTSHVDKITIASGQSSAQVQDQWTFDGQGTAHATDELRVLSPESAKALTKFTYSCTS
jgi:hypothetical protein